MRISTMILAFAKVIDETFIDEWKHEGVGVEQLYNDAIDFEVDGKQYSLSIKCHEEIDKESEAEEDE
jgi:hypothetical protein